MVLTNVIAFADLKTLQNLLPCKNLSLQITAVVNTILKSVQCGITFIFIEFSETTNSL